MRLAPGLAALTAILAMLVGTGTAAKAQLGQLSDAGSDAQDALDDALLATPNARTPAPLANLYATAPGLEQQIPASQLRANVVIPSAYNSNGDEVSSNGTPTGEIKPRGTLSLSGPLGSLPLRATVSAFAESDRYFRTRQMDLDKVGVSARLQYVDTLNDQAFAPFVAVAPRWDYAPTFQNQISARQDFNLGFNKRWNFDGNGRPLAFAPDTSAATIWSVGLTGFVQRRLREPQTSSDAIFLIPSASYVISPDWNASFATEFIGRWFDQNIFGVSVHDYEVHPIVTLEYVIPADVIGGQRNAARAGNPAIDFQGSYLKVWSTAAGGSFEQWKGVVALKLGW